ncbi:MAG: SH3 domain-containing protein [Chloroflexota bacterium]
MQRFYVGLVIAVLVIVNVLTFSAQQMALDREQDTVARLAGALNAADSTQRQLAATIAAQTARLADLEQGGLPTGALAVMATSTPTSVPTTDATPTPTPTGVAEVATATLTPTVAPTATVVPSPTATAASQPGDASLVGQTRFIATADGRGVRIRSACADASPYSGAWPEGTQVTIAGTDATCAGWLRVTSSTGQSGWVDASLLATTRQR